MTRLVRWQGGQRPEAAQLPRMHPWQLRSLSTADRMAAWLRPQRALPPEQPTRASLDAGLRRFRAGSLNDFPHSFFPFICIPLPRQMAQAPLAHIIVQYCSRCHESHRTGGASI